MKDEAADKFIQLAGIVGLTSDGEIAVLRNIGNTEDFVIACLVAQSLAHRMGKTAKQTMSADDLIGAGGMVQKTAKQTIYNAASALARNKIIQKRGNEYFVSERTELQFFAAKLPQLLKRT